MTQPVPMTMKSLVADYLDVRHAAGFALVHEESQLRAFALFADQRNHSGTITTDLALEWAQASRYGHTSSGACSFCWSRLIRRWSRHLMMQIG